MPLLSSFGSLTIAGAIKNLSKIPVSSIYIQDIYPVTGFLPITSISGAGWTGNISWSPAVSKVFQEGVSYSATISISEKDGYTTSGMSAGSISVKNSTSTYTLLNPISVVAQFPVTIASTLIDAYPYIPDSIAPSIGSGATTSISGAGWTGNISWSPAVSGVFLSNISYTASVVCTANAGYSFAKIVENSIRSSGNGIISVTNTAGSMESLTMEAQYSAQSSTPPIFTSAGGDYPTVTISNSMGSTTYSVNYGSTDIGDHAESESLQVSYGKYPGYWHLMTASEAALLSSVPAASQLFQFYCFVGPKNKDGFYNLYRPSTKTVLYNTGGFTWFPYVFTHSN
jgi:hypothetical protein